MATARAKGITVTRERKERVLALWLRCETQEAIAAAVGVEQQEVANKVGVLYKSVSDRNCIKAALFADDEWEPPQSVWRSRRLPKK